MTDHQQTTRRNVGEWVAWSSLLALLVIAVPPLICMPLWCDVTYYDFISWNMHEGKVLYRDLWEINFPGMAVIQCAVRWCVGFSVEALRIVDLAVVAFIAFLALRLVDSEKQLAASPGLPLGLFSLTVAMFYTSLTESCHCQRDVWMLCPILIALHIRKRSSHGTLVAPGWSWAQFGWSFLEGCVWGVAVWIKPHVLIVGLLVWLHSMLLRKSVSRFADTIGLLLGGIAVGIAGSAMLVASGAWSGFWEAMLEWNGEYIAGNTIAYRLRYYAIYGTRYLPWSLPLAVGIGAAIWTFVREALRRSADLPEQRATALLLSSAFIGWLIQAVVLQRPHDYVFIATTLLAMPVVLAQFHAAERIGRWKLIAWTIVGMCVLQHPALNARRLNLWRDCLIQGSTAEIRDQLAMVTGVGKTDWHDLSLVKRFLQRRKVSDGDVTCYSVSTHPLYLEMDIDAPTRYGYVDTLLFYHPSQNAKVAHSVLASGHTYVVADVWSSGMEPHPRVTDPKGVHKSLPRGFPMDMRNTFPWDQPILFRAGRYTVHRVRR